jgi:phage baseplate assembly protein W
MAIELGKVRVNDLKVNDYKVIGIGIDRSSNSNGIFSVNFTTISQAKDNLKNLIMTRKGERVMYPDFGCDIWELLFEPIITGEIDNKIEASIVRAANIWMPYISIDEIVFDYDDEDIDRHQINLEIRFSLKSNENLSETVTVSIKQ